MVFENCFDTYAAYFADCNEFYVIFGTMYPRMDQVEYVEDNH